MTKNIFLIIFLFIILQGNPSYSQTLTPQWSIQIGGPGNDRGTKIVSDLNNNIYFTGIFEKNAFVTCNGSSDSIVSSGQEDIYFGKINPYGQMVWNLQFGGKGSDSPTDLMIDIQGNIYLSGLFQDTLFLESDTLICSDYIDSFVVKFDSSGNVMWINQISGAGNQQCRSLNHDVNGNLIIGGFFTKTLEFSNYESPVFQSLGGFDAFIAKWTSQGVMEWVNILPGKADVMIKDLMVDGQNGYYGLGNFTDTIFYQNNQSFINSLGETDAFLFKYNEGGSLQWIKSFGGQYEDNAKCITIGGNEKVTIVGEFKENLIHENEVILSGEGGDDIFYLAFNKSGKLQNSKKHGLEKNDFVFDAWIPVGQKILMASDLRINPDNKNTLLANYELLGNMAEVYLTGTDLNPTVLSAIMPSIDQLYYCGSFHGTCIIDQINLISEGGEDFFLLKMGLQNQTDNAILPDTLNASILTIYGNDHTSNEEYEIASIIELKDDVDLFLNYPNPFRNETQILYFLPESCEVIIRIQDSKGQVFKEWRSSRQDAGKYSWDFKAGNLSGGIYECKFQAKGDNVFITKSIKMVHVK